MSIKDTKLEEKEQLVVHGDILADSFRDRTTGEKLVNAENELPSLSGNAGKFLKVNSGADGTEWANISGGTQLYFHHIAITDQSDNKYYLNVVSLEETEANNLTKLSLVLVNALSIKASEDDDYFQNALFEGGDGIIFVFDTRQDPAYIGFLDLTDGTFTVEDQHDPI